MPKQRAAGRLWPVDPRDIERIAKRRSLPRALREAVHVVTSLTLREAAVRFGERRLGYLWAFIEPMLFFAVFLSLRAFIRDRVPFGESAVLFLLSGFVTLRVALTIARRMMGAITGNAALLTFPPVQPFDLVLARFVVEGLTMGTVMLTFYFLVALVSEFPVFYDPVQFVLATLATLALGGGVGFLSAVLVILLPIYKTAFQLLSFPLLLCSAVFYVPALLPPHAQAILVWNPVLHCVEWFRSAIYLDYVTTLDRSYPLVFAAVAGGLGLVLARVFQTRLLD